MNTHVTANQEEALERFQGKVTICQELHLLTHEVCMALIKEGTRLRDGLTPEGQAELEGILTFLKDLREEFTSQTAA